ncbi:MAG: hypothetical protein GX974_10075 [Clostridiales bacterium]|nr:hypothetical protein [Clostridiales bacterium]
MRKGISDIVYEDPRIDFENRVSIDNSDEDLIIDRLDHMIKKIDVLLVADQLNHGIITNRVRQKLCNIYREGIPVIADSRNRIQLFKNIIIKPNEFEAVASIYGDIHAREIDEKFILDIIQRHYSNIKQPVIITMGLNGSLWYDGKKIVKAKSYPVKPPIDTVGAGDCFMAAFGSAFGAGIPGDKAVAFGNLASSVSIGKIGTTGTATPKEILKRFKEVEELG